MWEKNMTGSQIGIELGMTRNAVMGQLKRMRDKKMVEYRIDRDSVRMPVRRSITPNLTDLDAPPDAPVKKRSVGRFNSLTIPMTDEVKAFTDGPVRFMQLHPLSCRYVIGKVNGPKTMFCGKAKTYGAYCAEHHALCYQPPTPRPSRKAANYRRQY
jgi:hypothetical protein